MGELWRGGSAVWAVGIALTLLLGVYVGAYYAMVTRWYSVANYPAMTRFLPDGSHIIVRNLFRPIHWIDRRIRADYWESPYVWEVELPRREP